MRFHRSILLISTVAWFMIGMHIPALHQVTHHGSGISASLLAAMATLTVVGVVTLLTLLRAATPLKRQ